MYALTHKCSVCGAKHLRPSDARECARRDLVRMMSEVPCAPKRQRVPERMGAQ